MHIRNLKGPSRSPSCNSYVEMTLSTAKATATWDRRVDNMLSTPFDPHIINYEPSRGFIVPKFTMYDGTNDLFDHIMHFKRLMTLNIGNDALLCKVFPTNLHNQALSWFHYLP